MGWRQLLVWKLQTLELELYSHPHDVYSTKKRVLASPYYVLDGTLVGLIRLDSPMLLRVLLLLLVRLP